MSLKLTAGTNTQTKLPVFGLYKPEAMAPAGT
jgi:hypothetical protein